MENQPLSGYPTAFNFKGRVENQITADGYQGLVVSQQLPSLSLLGQAGRIYALSSGVDDNWQAPVQDTPTTAAAYVLYNGNAVSTKYALIPLLVNIRLGTGTPGIHHAALAGVTPTVQGTAVANSTGVVGPKSCSGSSNRASAATLSTGITLAAAPAWVGIANWVNTAAAGAGMGQTVRFSGEFVVPPGKCFAVHVIGATGTSPLYGVDVIYAEIELDLV